MASDQAPLTIGSWAGSGYVVQDPLTGSSAYLISGGTNGAFAAIARDIEVAMNALKIAVPVAAVLAQGVSAALLTLFNAPPNGIDTSIGIKMAEKLGVVIGALVGTLTVAAVYVKCGSVVAALLAASTVIGCILLPVVLGLGFIAALILELLLSELQSYIINEIIEGDRRICPEED